MTREQLLVKNRKGKWVQRFYEHIKHTQTPTEDDLAFLSQHQALGSRIREAAVSCGCGPRLIANIDLIQLQILRWVETYRTYLEAVK